MVLLGISLPEEEDDDESSSLLQDVKLTHIRTAVRAIPRILNIFINQFV
jgi:hypothetical protein